MNASKVDLLPSVEHWLSREPRIQSAVLFGSKAGSNATSVAPDDWSDIDLHVITTAASELEHVDWQTELPDEDFCFQSARAATGGVRKTTVLFAKGQIDLVLVPKSRMRLARVALTLKLYRRSRAVRMALNEIATCLWSGYRFLKGETEWGRFYAKVASDMPGVRLSDQEIRSKAEVSLCDLLWIFQKIERGEFVAAQHLLHRSLSETNLMLLRELRLRRGGSLPSFGLGRRVEQWASPEQLQWISVNAGLNARELRAAAWTALAGLRALMRELTGEWDVPNTMMHLLAPYQK